MQQLSYPMSVFNYVFRDLTDAAHLRISIPEATTTWLSQLSGDSRQHANTGFTPEENLLHKQDHRRVFYLLLRIMLPAAAMELIDKVERAENLKNQCVDEQKFEDAARFLHERDLAFKALSQYVPDSSTLSPSHIKRLFEMLAVDSPTHDRQS